MSRSGYSDDNDDPLELGRWRAQVDSAIRGKRGQSFLRNLIAALDAMPVKRLVTSVLQDENGDVCVLGAALKHAGKECPISDDEHDFDQEWTASQLDIATQLVAETVYENDEVRWFETPEGRWIRMRQWAVSKVRNLCPTNE